MDIPPSGLGHFMRETARKEKSDKEKGPPFWGDPSQGWQALAVERGDEARALACALAQ
jgi:hypothetical protein